MFRDNYSTLSHLKSSQVTITKIWFINRIDILQLRFLSPFHFWFGISSFPQTRPPQSVRIKIIWICLVLWSGTACSIQLFGSPPHYLYVLLTNKFNFCRPLRVFRKSTFQLSKCSQNLLKISFWWWINYEGSLKSFFLKPHFSLWFSIFKLRLSCLTKSSSLNVH